jgi:hypothetical protein
MEGSVVFGLLFVLTVQLFSWFVVVWDAKRVGKDPHVW